MESAAFSAIIIVGALVLLPIKVGMMEASTTLVLRHRELASHYLQQPYCLPPFYKSLLGDKEFLQYSLSIHRVDHHLQHLHHFQVFFAHPIRIESWLKKKPFVFLLKHFLYLSCPVLLKDNLDT